MGFGSGLGGLAGGLMGGLVMGKTMKGLGLKETIGDKLFGGDNPISSTIAGAAGVNAAVDSGALSGNNSSGGVTAMLDDGGDTSGGVGGMTSGLPVLGASLLGDKTSKDNSKSDGIWSHLSSLLGD